jgi:hypothetical protein
MKAMELYYTENRLNVITPFAVSILIVMYLFFIDDGSYSFEWMLKPWNYYPFAVYVAGFMLGQLIVASFLFGKLNGLVNTITVFVLGLPAGALMSFILICCCGLASLAFGWT